ncbi:LysR family transcriptional regulator [Paenibacillus hodogayensis]|uniref:LysR family transcriptional regulator n=1 Tax=Paenibacillus hodogayensis TaxID=279208 RepID=A0ABV5VYV5_9BACL
MELRQIQYFIEVAKLEHVTEASYVLHVAQSAVSRQIFKLEAELGVDLFIRDGRKVRLTPIGKMFLGHMQQALQVIEKAQQEIEDFLDPQRGTVRIGFPSSLASHMLPMVISAFRDKYPKVQFQLQHGSYRELIDLVSKGMLNLSLIGPVPKGSKQINGDTLFLERIVALLPAHHPLAGQTSLKLSQLRNDNFVLFPEGFVLRDLVIDACASQGFEPIISFEGDDIDAIRGLVAAGLGITLLPEIALNDSIPRSTVKIHFEDPQVTRSVGIITPASRELPPTEKLFYDFIKTFFANVGRFNNE